MYTISQALQRLLVGLQLSQAEREEASRQHINMREKLQQRLAVEENFLAGSYARSTAVRPLNDIDIFLVLRRDRAHDPSTPPAQVLAAVKRALEGIYPGKRATLGARSVNIEFSGTGIAYDVVPAFTAGAGVYTIPDIEARSWIHTNPRIHQDKATEANRRAGDKLRPLLKAVKHANNHHGGIARSFHLEVLSWQVLIQNPGNFLDGLVLLLDGLARWACERCPDPAGLGPDIQPSPEKCREAQRWLAEMATLARQARSLDTMGRRVEAHQLMRGLFGDAWRLRQVVRCAASAG